MESTNGACPRDGVDTPTPTGKLMLTVLSGVAQFEREIMLERQREGAAKANAAGKYKGRKSISSDRRDAVLQLATLGTTQASIARHLRLGKATVYRVLRANRPEQPRENAVDR